MVAVAIRISRRPVDQRCATPALNSAIKEMSAKYCR